jgi:hypothetical protein
MVTNDGDTEGLFRAGFMQSGSPNPLGDITDGQPIFDMLVNNTGCLDAKDKLDCLRNVPEEEFQKAVDTSPSFFGPMVCRFRLSILHILTVTTFKSLNLAWRPRTDGTFLKDDPQKLVLNGNVATIPFVNGESYHSTCHTVLSG